MKVRHTCLTNYIMGGTENPHTILTFNLHVYRAGLRIRNQWDPYDFSASIKTHNPDFGYDLVSVNLI